MDANFKPTGLVSPGPNLCVRTRTETAYHEVDSWPRGYSIRQWTQKFKVQIPPVATQVHVDRVPFFTPPPSPTPTTLKGLLAQN